MNWIELFRVGTHTDSAGNQRSWTKEDLETIAAKYNSGEHEAPLVIGHPESNAPAYGWIKKLRLNGDVLEGLPYQVQPDFADLVNSGAYKKRSISLYPDFTLRHVGFLGAMPPAVKGLKDAKFQASATAWTYEDSIGAQSEHEETMKYLKLPDGRIINATTGQVVTPDNPEFADWQAKGGKLFEVAAKPADHQAPSTNGQQTVAKQAKPEQADIPAPGQGMTADHSEVIQLKARLAQVEGEARRDRAKAFKERMVAEGRLTPDQAQGLEEFMSAVDGGDLTLTFAEGAKPAGTWLRDFLSRLPQHGMTNRLSGGQPINHAEDDKAGASIAQASGFGPKQS